MKSTITTLTAVILSAGLLAGNVQADGMTFKAQKTKTTFHVATAAKPAVCGQGFTAVSKKLVEHEGKKWYQYTCAREETIIRVCNTDTDVIDVKNQFISLPSDGTSQNSKLRMSYKCFKYVPVK